MTENQKLIADAIRQRWPNAEMPDHDAACFEVLVDSELPEVAEALGSLEGVCYGQRRLSGTGGSYIDF